MSNREYSGIPDESPTNWDVEAEAAVFVRLVRSGSLRRADARESLSITEVHVQELLRCGFNPNVVRKIVKMRRRAVECFDRMLDGIVKIN